MQFGPLLARGLHKIEEWLYFFPPGQELPDPSTRIFPAELAFELHDTDGLPIDLTIDALREHEVQVDLAGFESLMEEQRERGRAARKDDALAPEIVKLDAGASSTFIGHHRYDAESEVLAVRESRSRPKCGIVSIRTRGINQRRQVVIEFTRSFMVFRRAAPEVDAVFPVTETPWGVGGATP